MRRVGLVRLANQDRTCERFADGTWRVTTQGRDDPSYAALLKRHYEGFYEGPSHGFPGVPELHDLAELLDGTVELDPRPDAPPNTVY